jgi:hypothetical protein
MFMIVHDMKGKFAMKKISLLLSLLVIVSLACGVTIDLTPEPKSPTAETTPVLYEPPTTTPEIFIALTQAMPATAMPPEEISFAPLRLSLPRVIASGARGEQVPPANGADLPYWGLTPGHTVLNLEGYVLQGKFHQPQIFVYPAQAYAELVPAAFESIRRIDNILYPPGGPALNDELPAVPFFNAAQVFASNQQIVSFQNGGGVRFVTEYSQYFATVNNTDLFYHFAGVTRDGEYYIVAILPVTAPGLAETSDPGSAVPTGGIAHPDINDPNADWQGYYAAVTNQLNATDPEAFYPSLNQLDALIQSLLIEP